MADSPTSRQDDGQTSTIVITVPRTLKGRVVGAHRKRGINLETWMAEAIREKLEREGG